MTVTRSLTQPLTRPLAAAVTQGVGGSVPPLFTGGEQFAVLGDSITAAGRSGSASTALSLARGYPTWSDILSDKTAKLLYANNYGVSGDRTDQAAVRVPDVIAAAVKACVVLVGTNDVSQAVSSATIITNLGDIYDDLTAAGIVVIGIPILPRGGGSALSGAQQTVVSEVNTWIRAQTSRTLFRLADPVSDLEDTGAGGYAPLSGMMHDGLHPTAKGAYYVGKAVARVLDGLFSDDTSLATLGSLIGNPTLTGTAGVKNTLTGEVADGWTGHSGNTGGATVVASKRTDSDGVVWQRFTFSGAYTGTTRAAHFYRNITAGDWLSGDVGRAWCRVRMGASPVGLRPPSLQMQMGTFTSTDLNTPVVTDPIPTEEWEGVLRCFDFTMPSNSASPRVFVNMPLADTGTTDAVSGWVEFALVGSRKGA